MKISSLLTFAVLTGATMLHPAPVQAWHDATHMAVVKAAGLDDYAYLAVGPDIAKEKAGEIESGNHYNNTPQGVVITPEFVLGQFVRYNKTDDTTGHLYGAIIASINDYIIRSSGGKYGLYPLGYAAHYIGDLSMPLHNSAYNEFNKKNHAAMDGTVEYSGAKDEPTDAKVARLAAEIKKRMAKLPPLELRREVKYFYLDVATEVARMANNSAAIAYRMQDTEPPQTSMTEDEAYSQLAQSSRLLKAVYQAVTR